MQSCVVPSQRAAEPRAWWSVGQRAAEPFWKSVGQPAAEPLWKAVGQQAAEPLVWMVVWQGTVEPLMWRFVIIFPSDWSIKNIAFLEFYPIVVALQIFGKRITNRQVVFHCDNKAIVEVINKQRCKDKEIMKLMRHLVLTAMQYNIRFTAMHVPGKQNHLADALSRLQATSYLLKQYGMQQEPTQVPQRLQPQHFKPI